MMLAKDIAKKKGFYISSGSTLEKAVEIMIENGTGTVALVEDGKPAGILTERDIVSFLCSKVSLESSLSGFKKDVITVPADRTLFVAINTMVDKNIRRVVVVDDNGRFTGIITQEDLIRHLEKDVYQKHTRAFHMLYRTRTLFTVSADTRLLDAVGIMSKNRIGAVIALSNGKAAGIITEKDVLRLVRDRTDFSLTVRKFMSSPVITVMPDTLVTKVMSLMRENNIRRVVVNDRDGKPLGVITNRDILRNMEGGYSEFLKSKLKHAREILDFLPEIILEVADHDKEKLVQWCNKKTVFEFGQGLLGSPITSLIPGDEWAKIYRMLITKGKIEKLRLEINRKIYEVSASYMKILKDGIIQLTMKDLTHEVKLSTKDYLTDLYNRRKFAEILDTEAERSARYGQRLSMIMLDIDYFKRVNDKFGHQCGDRVLKEVAGIVKNRIRQVDYAARYGGEEFVVLLPGTDRKGAAILAEAIRHLVEKHRFGLGRKVTLSAGVTQFRRRDSKETFMERADKALYKSKNNGRNMVATA